MPTNICDPFPRRDLPSQLNLDGVASPRIDGYINMTGDGIGDNLTNWNGTEYDGFLQLDMFTAGVSSKPLMGRAYIGYDCNQRLLCIAAHLLANDTCNVEENNPDSWVEFTEGGLIAKLHESTSGANFRYVKYSGGSTGRTIGTRYAKTAIVSLYN
jgi:hypothetical protein